MQIFWTERISSIESCASSTLQHRCPDSARDMFLASLVSLYKLTQNIVGGNDDLEALKSCPLNLAWSYADCTLNRYDNETTNGFSVWLRLCHGSPAGTGDPKLWVSLVKSQTKIPSRLTCSLTRSHQCKSAGLTMQTWRTQDWKVQLVWVADGGCVPASHAVILPCQQPSPKRESRLEGGGDGEVLTGRISADPA